ncbi:MAG: ABC transporter ATP-binding protein [Eubacteriales bacterium]
MKKEKTKSQKKDKPLSFRRVLSDNLFVLKIVQKTAPLYLFTYYLWSVLWGVISFLSGSYLLRYVVNGIGQGKTPVKILTFILFIIGLNLAYEVFRIAISRFYFPRCDQKIVASFEKMLFQKSREVEIACYEKPEFYDKYVRSMDDVYGKCMDVVYNIDNLIWTLTSFSANAFLLYIIDPVLILFGLIPFALGFIRRAQNKVNHKYDVERNPIDRKKNYVQRTFYLSEYAKEMRLGGMARLMFGRQKEAYEDYRRLIRKYGFIQGLLGFLIGWGVDILAIVGAMGYAVYQTVVSGRMLLGDCIVVLTSVSMISHLLSTLVQRFSDFHKNALYVEDFRFFLDHKPEIADCDHPKAPHEGDLSAKNLSFTYFGAEKPSLTNLNFTIHKGEKIALVGQNGSGKTTLVKLLLRLYDPTEGKLTLDGVDVKELSVTDYRRMFGVVFQDFKIFSLSVAENVLMRSMKEGEEEVVIDALKKSGGYDKVATFEKGIHTTLTREFDDSGVNLSGGEAQKISLARIFADPTPYVILDEPSSALDPIAEYTMFQNMMEAGKGRTMIFISHRLSCATLADRVFYMEKGELCEMGTHAELMKQGGRYAELFEMQAENYLENEEQEGGISHV